MTETRLPTFTSLMCQIRRRHNCSSEGKDRMSHYQKRGGGIVKWEWGEDCCQHGRNGEGEFERRVV
ncbi:hypothetical protein A2U01_0082535, partial [Trifolium medium]|nr:hypothetical protein [Trifolium medium]